MKKRNADSEKLAENQKKFFPIILIGLLSMYFAEIFSGASHLWFLDLWGIFVTFPLYMFHLLFFLNIAMKFKRKRIPQLYILGMLFALYESWITKVLWNGYIVSDLNAKPIFGLFLSVGLNEYVVLVGFWHPILSFLTPIIIYEMLAISSEGKIISSHYSALKKGKKQKFFLIMIYVFGAIFQLNGAFYDLFTAFFSILGNLILIEIFYKLSIRKGKPLSIERLQLSTKQLIIVGIYLICLYITCTFALLPQFLPKDPIAYATILISYIIFILLFKISRRDPNDKYINIVNIDSIESDNDKSEVKINNNIECLMKKDFNRLNIMLFVLCFIFYFTNYITLVVSNILYLSLFALGIFTPIYIAKQYFKSINRRD
ncbi:MAG: hypothetical protein ACTSRZ_04235 [Promethearchaeota archaeon]